MRFNNVVSARWRRRTGQGACLIKYALLLLLFNISIDNSVEKSTCLRYACMHAWQSKLDSNGQGVSSDKHGFDSMHGGLMCIQTLASFY